LYVRKIAINSLGDIYVGTEGGVFRSTNDGDTWTAINGGLTNLDVYAVAFNPNGVIFAGTWGNGVFRLLYDEICGDVNLDEQINSADLVYLVNYYFNIGPRPMLNYYSDFNCDDKIGLDDIIILQRHIYHDGYLTCCTRKFRGITNINEINVTNPALD
jgi:hypothetical protein